MKRSDDGKLKSITVLKLKLDLAQEQAGKAEELHRIAALCRRGRNAGAMNWLMRQHGYPQSEAQRERKAKKAQFGDKPKCEASLIYHAVRAASQGLTGTIQSMLANEIASFLAAKQDWRNGKAEDGKRPKRKDAILSYEARPPYFTEMQIPVRATEATFRFDGVPMLTCRLLLGQPTTLQIKTASLPARIRNMLYRIAAGERPLTDSKLLLRDDEWYWFLPQQFESTAVDAAATAHLWPVIPGDEPPSKYDQPFTLYVPGRDKPWMIGDGWYLRSQAHRIETLRKEIGWRYRNGHGLGHGRSKVDSKMKAIGKRFANIVDEFRKRLISDVAKASERFGCGTVVYHEPTLPARERCWFAARGLDWNWTTFVSNLENNLARRGLVLEVVRLKASEIASKSGGNKELGVNQVCEAVV